MVVIFGFGRGKQEDLGEVALGMCPNCHNQVYLHHVRSKKSVRLYFVPVVPYGTDNYLVCPICSRGLNISHAQLPHIRSMSAATASFRARRLPEAQYMAQVERFWQQLGVNPAGQQILSPASPGTAPTQAGIPPSQPLPYSPRRRRLMMRTHGYRSWQNLRGCTTRKYFLTLTMQQPIGAFR
jgi:hypothetical protein